MKVWFKKYKVLVVTLAVIVLPLAYAYLYLWAFWDPYSRLSELPIAVVNLDQGATLNGQFKNVGDGVIDTLKTDDNVKWVFTDEADATEGLANRRYYGSVVFPENFSQNIATVADIDKVQGLFVYKINEKRNFLAGQVMNRVAIELKESITQKISAEIVKKMTDDLKLLPGSLADLQDGLQKINDGTTTLSDKMGDLIKGQNRFNQGVLSLNSGLNLATTGSQSLQEGAASLNGGVKQISDGLSALNTGTAPLVAGASQLETGLTTFDGKLSQFASGASKYLEGAQQSSAAQARIGSALQQYIGAHPEAMKDPQMQIILKTMSEGKAGSEQLAAANASLQASILPLTEASQKLVVAATKINGGVTAVSGNIEKLAQGSTALATGSDKLAIGTKSLNEGLGKVQAGSDLLKTSAAKLLSGEKKLQDGLEQVNTGVEDANSGVKTAKDEAQDKVSSIDNVDTFVSEPVLMQDEKINPIPDYGTAFTPYFVSLSLWVGALMMFFAIYLDVNVSKNRATSTKKSYIRFFAYTGIGIAQAVVVAFMLINSLHLEVKNVALFYVACVAISLTFVSMMRFLLVHLKDAGKFVGVLLLILQLTACGGTFPMELVPSFFQKINPFMPMTYSVNVLKEVISGIDYAFLSQNMMVLMGLLIAFTALNLGLAKYKVSKNPELAPIF